MSNRFFIQQAKRHYQAECRQIARRMELLRKLAALRLRAKKT